MKVEEVLSVLRHYRHDWMNQLQLVYGYASMDKLDKVKEKLTEVLNESQQESRLLGLNAPHFALWTIQFNSVYQQFTLQYEIENKHDLSSYDLPLLSYCNELMDVLNEHISTAKLYQMKVAVSGEENCNIFFHVMGKFEDEELLLSKINEKSFIKEVQKANSEKENSFSVQLLLNER